MNKIEKNIVSVCMITYNHANFIIQAIESVLNQKTNFNFELIIANDNSNDETHYLIQKYLAENTEIKNIKYLKNEKNMGMMPNFINALKFCNGKYVGLCEGDDYWTNPFKLQKQVDFLEKNENFSICFHPVNIDQNGKICKDEITKKVRQITTINDLAKGNYIHTCSVLYRNNLIHEFPEYFYHTPVGDYFLHMLNSKFGKIFCIDEIMANYRVHDESYWSSKKQIERNEIWVAFLENIKPNFNYKIKNYLQEQIEKTNGTFISKNVFKKIQLKFNILYFDFLKLK